MRAINDLDIPSPVLRQIAAFWQIGEVSLGKDAEHMEVSFEHTMPMPLYC